jgi:hypothetical protein
MRFTVIWRLSAIDQLNAVTAAADDPAAVREAAARVDYMLRRWARDLGESRGAGFRLWYEDVLGVFYRIDENAMRGEVLFAGPARRRWSPLQSPAHTSRETPCRNHSGFASSAAG